MEGYKVFVLMLILGIFIGGDNDEFIGKKWEVGVLVLGGFENKEVFYGSFGCCLFVILLFFLFLWLIGIFLFYFEV